MEVTYQITSLDFCAAISVRGGEVTKAAPVLKEYLGWGTDLFFAYCDTMGWEIKVIQVN